MRRRRSPRAEVRRRAHDEETIRTFHDHGRLVVSHAGSGSVVGALAHGLPMVLLPIGADQPLNAARCQELDVARALDPFQVTAADVSEAASNVLSDDRYRRNAQRLKREIDASPGPDRALYLIERVAAD